MALSEKKKKAVKEKIKKFLDKHSQGRGKDKVVKAGLSIGFMSEDENIGKIERLPSGVLGLDVLTGGGWAKGKINQIWGAEGVGKSTIMLLSIANAQKNVDDFLAAYLNNERTLDRTYANTLGVNFDEILVADTTTTDEAGDLVNDLADSATGVDFIAFDTIQALSPEGEIVTSAGKEKSLADNTMALIPRAWSQFLRMYTSKNLGMTLLLGSQVRMDLGSNKPTAKETGGNAIKHYNLLTVSMKKLSITSTTNWPYACTYQDAPPNSYPVMMKIEKAKLSNRYSGCKLMMYYYKGSFERKFNVLAIAKDLGLHDGRTLKYITTEVTTEEGLGGALGKGGTKQVEKEFKARGFKDMYKRVPDEAIDYLETQLMDAYTQKISLELETETEEEDG